MCEGECVCVRARVCVCSFSASLENYTRLGFVLIEASRL